MKQSDCDDPQNEPDHVQRDWKCECRWYCRYAGWAPGQLQAEIDKGVWFTAAASKDMILHPCCLINGQQHWHTVMQRMGGEFAQLSQALLVEPEVHREVWGKTDYLKSSQGQEQTRPDGGNEDGA